MVETPKRIGSPVAGWRQVRAASRSSSPRSSPFAGGEASSCPTTEKRRWAQDSWTGGFRLPGIFAPRLEGARTLFGPPTAWRRASSAGRRGPSASLRGRPAGERAQEAQQQDEPLLLAAPEALEEGER